MSDTDDEFVDAEEGSSMKTTPSMHSVVAPQNKDSTPIEATLASCHFVKRDRLPAARPKGYSGLWSVMKSAVGKDLSKIPMPVQFNEPLSFLQRLHEDLEYAEILDRAAAEPNSLLRLAHVAAFSSTIFASSAGGARIYKAFNPILGETYELVDPEKGFRSVSEQVSHHPPISAVHTESVHGWRYQQEYHAATKFSILGTLKVIPTGCCQVTIPSFGDIISWCKPATTVHNLIIGKIWIDQEGDVILKNHATGERCQMKWSSYSEVGKQFTWLHGYVFDKKDEIRYTVHGSWDSGVVVSVGKLERKQQPTFTDAVMDPKNTVLWKAAPMPDYSSTMFGFPLFSMYLNQEMRNVCPTDSRYRQDQRSLEMANMDLASSQKHKLEELQRKHRKERESKNITYKPTWFHEEHHQSTNYKFHTYNGGYWDAKQDGSFGKRELFAQLFAID